MHLKSGFRPHHPVSCIVLTSPSIVETGSLELQDSVPLYPPTPEFIELAVFGHP